MTMTEMTREETEAIAATALDPFVGLQDDVADTIVLDVALGVPIEESKITYGDAEKSFRAEVEGWVAENPDATIDLPFDAAPAEMTIPEDAG
jgi:hypothetical protein